MRQPRSTKPSVAENITNAIIARLEAGARPWVRPWRGAGHARGRRPLRSCGTPYRGINAIVLGMIADMAGFSSPYWMTYNHAQSLGGQVRKGERGTIAVLYKTCPPANDDSRDEPDEENAVRRLLRGYTVFSADQIDGLPERYRAAAVAPTSDRIRELETFFERIPATVRHGGNEACYLPARDVVHMPHRAAFVDEDHWAGTFAHELAHWTGHGSRLARDLSGRFGSDAYAAEELIAELTAAIMGGELGTPVTHLDHHASYLDHWLRILRKDARAILTAAGHAEKAASHLLALGGRSTVADASADDEPQLQEAA